MSSRDPRPVVVLTAGGVGRNLNATIGVKKSNASSSSTTTTSEQQREQQQPQSSSSPAARESSDSFLDQEEPPETTAPFVDDPNASMLLNDNDASKGAAAPAVDPWMTPSSDAKAILPAEKPCRVSSTGAMSSAPATKSSELLWLLICFLGIMASFVCYGLLLEYATSGGRKLHELSFLFVTSGLYTMTAAAGRYVRDETPTTIPPARFAVLGLTSMGSTFFSVRSLRYVFAICLFA